MFGLLRQPYPSINAPVRQLRTAALVGLFIGLFLLVFQPFGLNSWQTPDKVLKILGFGVVTFTITAFNFIVWPFSLPRQFAEERWTVSREILFLTGNVLLIGMANRVYLAWLLKRIENSGPSWPGMIFVTFLIALFPVTGLVLLNYIRQLKKYTQSAAELPVHLAEPTRLPVENRIAALSEPGQKDITALTLVAENEKDNLTFAPADLLLIESSDNYCTVVYLKTNATGLVQPTKPLLRSSLSRLEGQVAERSALRPHIVRCHRSYIVNLDRVERITGNAQGYKLHLLGGEFVVPVARKYNETVVAELKAL